MGVRYELAGQKFGYLDVLRMVEPRPEHHGQRAWLCECDCGRMCEVTSRDLRTGHTKSCGCKKAELISAAITTHGMAGYRNKAPEYRVWSEMIQRCENPKCNRFYRYGARGIRICKRWRESFEAFIEDMGRRPEKGFSIERRDNDGDYEPGNCFWATRKQQMRNRKGNRLITANGVTRTLAEWAEVTGLWHSTITMRLKRGLSPEQAMLPGRVYSV